MIDYWQPAGWRRAFSANAAEYPIFDKLRGLFKMTTISSIVC